MNISFIEDNKEMIRSIIHIGKLFNVSPKFESSSFMMQI